MCSSIKGNLNVMMCKFDLDLGGQKESFSFVAFGACVKVIQNQHLFGVLNV